jgi:glycosyltransferase involved in cell wall biosynthesis
MKVYDEEQSRADTDESIHGPRHVPPVSILYLSGLFLPLVGGSEVGTLREAKALQARAHTARVLTQRQWRSWPRHEAIDGVPVSRTGGVFVRGRLRMRYGATWLAEALVWLELVRRRHTYDVVHLKQLGRLARPAILASIVTRKPLIVEVASGPVGSQKESLADAMQQLPRVEHYTPKSHVMHAGRGPVCGDIESLRQVQWLAGLTLHLLRAPQVRFRALSSRIATSLIQSGFHPRSIILAPNGVDPLLYTGATTADAARRGDVTSTVVCVARYSHEKGLDVLLHAWRIVQSRVPAAQLILAGDGPMRLQLMALAEALGVSNSVEFAGLIRNVPALLSKADVFVLPSRYEGMPNALLEAMASGLPCVATCVSGSEDLIIDGVSGLLAPPEDPDRLADALVTLLLDRAMAQTLAEAARARVTHAFSEETVTQTLIKLYSSMTTKHHAHDLPATEGIRMRPSSR